MTLISPDSFLMTQVLEKVENKPLLCVLGEQRPSVLRCRSS